VAVVLLAAVLGGLWSRSADGPGWQALIVAAGFAVTAIFGIGWLARLQTERRLRAALDAHAEREIAQARRPE
jgi:hypothetical protein